MRGYPSRQLFSAEEISAQESKLKSSHFAILMASLTHDYAAMAAMFNVSMGTIRSRLHRARQAMAKIAQATHGD